MQRNFIQQKRLHNLEFYVASQLTFKMRREKGNVYANKKRSKV
jgi:hypothetical protein